MILVIPSSNRGYYIGKACVLNSELGLVPFRIQSYRRKVPQNPIRLRIVPDSFSSPEKRINLSNAAPVPYPKTRRTRRPNLRPILKGNNSHGRTGKRRCLQCRIWKQKCEYENVDNPCKVCFQKGLHCGAEQKVLAKEFRSRETISKPESALVKVSGSRDSECADEEGTIEVIPREPPTPIDLALGTFDFVYIQFYWSMSSLWFDLINDGKTDVIYPLTMCTVRRFGPYIDSKLVRSAVLFYSSYRKEGGISYLAMQYLNQFYERAREAIEQESYVELVYACYTMCLFEMGSKRRFGEEFTRHANGFLVSYRNLWKKCTLMAEESKFLNDAYEMIQWAINVSTSRWHQQENWLVFIQACIQRLDSVESRLLDFSKTIATSDTQRIWIPASHHLFPAEEYMYELCKLFDRLSVMLRSGADERSLYWIETTVALQNCLNDLWQILCQPPRIQWPDSQQDPPTLYVLKDDRSTLAGDKHTRQLLNLYYVFLLQYLLLVEEWSEFTHIEATQTARAVCRLFPPPHESTYPTPEIRYIVNRGLILAAVVEVECRNIDGILLSYTTTDSSQCKH